jgi:hypothetical protein
LVVGGEYYGAKPPEIYLEPAQEKPLEKLDISEIIPISLSDDDEEDVILMLLLGWMRKKRNNML